VRGQVIALTAAERVARARYLASPTAPAIYYRLDYPNGGANPEAADPAARWAHPGSSFTNVTADCIAGAAWCAGFDRYQPVRFAHIYEGSINCDSIRLDVAGPGRCFERLAAPAPGCMVVYGSLDYDGDHRWDRIGHIGTVVEVPAEWDARERACWQALGVVDIAGRKGRANARTTGGAWFGADRQGKAKDAWFVRSTMHP